MIQPTGNGKSQFSAVYTKKLTCTFVITLTIILMQDQTHYLSEIFLSSAQMKSDVSLLFVIPEYFFNRND